MTPDAPMGGHKGSGVLRIGTRASALARTQSEYVAALLRDRLGVETTLVDIVSEGDRNPGPLDQIGGTGVFVTAVREAVVAGTVEVAVHSLKDLPTQADNRLTLAAVPRREDPRDALVARDGLTLGELPAGARVGTGSPRRAAQIHALGLGVDVVPIRGNVDTRLRKVAAGEMDAVVLARAGLLRLDRADVVTEILDPIQVLPAPGQGALAVEVSSAVPALAAEVAAALDDADSRACVTAERALLAALEAGCTAPVGALAEVAEGDDGPEIYLRGVVSALDGSNDVRLSATGHPAHAADLGRRLADEMLSVGAAQLMGETVR
ncbi:MAG: hydroxymethylbilane synthase [Nocardioidaceae bacterium]